jgi:hypothetical protein
MLFPRPVALARQIPDRSDDQVRLTANTTYDVGVQPQRPAALRHGLCSIRTLQTITLNLASLARKQDHREACKAEMEIPCQSLDVSLWD